MQYHGKIIDLYYDNDASYFSRDSNQSRQVDYFSPAKTRTTTQTDSLLFVLFVLDPHPFFAHTTFEILFYSTF